MQLFYCPTMPVCDGEFITIDDRDIVHQCLKVLRFRGGDRAMFQYDRTRWLCSLNGIDPSSLVWAIEETIMCPYDQNHHAICLAMLNKRDKVELIVHKLAEVGLGAVYLYASTRSIIRECNPKKLARLQSIAREASEQSRNRYTPTIQRVDTIPVGYTCVKADFGGDDMLGWLSCHDGSVCLCIGPEGGWDDRDRAIATLPSVSLGSHVLRSETACIVGGWILGR